MGYSQWSPTITVATTGNTFQTCMLCTAALSFCTHPTMIFLFDAGMPITGETLHKAVTKDSIETVVEILEAV